MKGHKFIKPAHKGLIIRDPISKQKLPEDGYYKPFVGREGTYWKRRLRDGSIVILPDPQETVVEVEPKKRAYKKREVNS